MSLLSKCACSICSFKSVTSSRHIPLARCFFVQLPVALPRSVKHPVELQAAQPPILADLLFGFGGKVEAAEYLAVALGAKLLKHLAHAPRSLAGDDPVQCPRLRRLD